MPARLPRSRRPTSWRRRSPSKRRRRTPARWRRASPRRSRRIPFLVFAESARILGYAYGSTHRSKPAYRWSVETTVYVALDAHRRGIGRALYAELIAVLTRPGFHTGFADIVPPKEPSVGLHEAMGFAYLGTFPRIGVKHGRW